MMVSIDQAEMVVNILCLTGNSLKFEAIFAAAYTYVLRKIGLRMQS